MYMFTIIGVIGVIVFYTMVFKYCKYSISSRGEADCKKKGLLS